MARGVRWYLVGCFVLVSLAGCGRGFFSAEREPWRAEAEIACLKSGAVKESTEIVRIDPISGPGMCGADYPFKVAALGESVGSQNLGSHGFAAEDLRPPAAIGNPPRWPIREPRPRSPENPSYPQTDPQTAVRGLGYAPPNGPISLTAPGVPPEEDEINLPPEGVPGLRQPVVRGLYSAPQAAPPASAQPYPPSRDRYVAPYSPPDVQPLAPLRLGPAQGNPVAALGPVAVRPAATLACPIVSVLDRWLADSVQPAATRWFGARVVEIKQMSAYSCRGMNGNSGAHISEHAFGNALDIAAFTLADGRRITVKDGWRGLPEEQGFLRDVQAAACQQFSTVLAPGSNAYHYDHIHVDLMRRASRRVVCEPQAISGEEIAARVGARHPYASREPSVTGSLGAKKTASRPRNNERTNEEDEFADE